LEDNTLTRSVREDVNNLYKRKRALKEQGTQYVDVILFVTKRENKNARNSGLTTRSGTSTTCTIKMPQTRIFE